MIESDLQIPECQFLEIGVTAPIGRDGDVSPVRRPAGVQVRVPVIGELLKARACDVDRVEVADPSLDPREREAPAVGREGGVLQPVQVQADLARDTSALDIVKI